MEVFTFRVTIFHPIVFMMSVELIYFWLCCSLLKNCSKASFTFEVLKKLPLHLTWSLWRQFLFYLISHLGLQSPVRHSAAAAVTCPWPPPTPKSFTCEVHPLPRTYYFFNPFPQFSFSGNLQPRFLNCRTAIVLLNFKGHSTIKTKNGIFFIIIIICSDGGGSGDVCGFLYISYNFIYFIVYFINY